VDRLLVIGKWLLVIGYWEMFNRNWILVGTEHVEVLLGNG